jgi:chromosome segregation protein
MYLKRIELTGFKSFAQKTVLDFLPSCSISKNGKQCGVTAIVGPNGSGKSNVADAVKWAMGEQSLKNLRGKKSEDVIFAGSGKKAQLGSAKVSLYFDNSDKKIPIEYEEVIITRKVYRSGEGEYFINGSKVRLIDIVDLLARAGVGQRSYCIINQGMADAVLNASPFERKAILEEAAGVKPYQLKKDRSLKKLETTRNNLVRVTDLVAEIEPHLRVLKRQSEKAKRSEEVTRELREKQEELYSFLWQRMISEKQTILQEKEELGREDMKLQRKIDDLEIKVREESKSGINFENQRNYLEKERQETFEKINRIQKDLAILEAKIEIEKEKAKNFAEIREIRVNFPYVRDKIFEINKKFEKLLEKSQGIESAEDFQELKKEFREIGSELSLLKRELIEGKKNLKEAPMMENTVDLRIIGDLEKRKLEFEEVYAKLTQESETNKAKIDKLIFEDRESRKHFFELEGELRRKQQEIGAFKDKINEIRIRLARLEVREEDLANRIKEELRIFETDDILKKKIGNGEVDVEKYEREIGRLKILAEQIGAIDPMIIEEYEETQKRYDFLTNQSEDLEKAIVTFSEVIKEMEEKIKEAFEETYKRVNSEFAKYFKIIFGGGSADLEKVKITSKRMKSEKADIEGESESGENLEENTEEEIEEKETELGIEIKASPPGKRISGLNMLSGGERALTSLALLFAIISNSPPPFTVLDEVEAALDEANSKRFSRILTELSNETQFILITHNRETMRQASVLYGVTMSADGVSKVLSVKLDQVGMQGEIK